MWKISPPFNLSPGEVKSWTNRVILRDLWIVNDPWKHDIFHALVENFLEISRVDFNWNVIVNAPLEIESNLRTRFIVVSSRQLFPFPRTNRTPMRIPTEIVTDMLREIVTVVQSRIDRSFLDANPRRSLLSLERIHLRVPSFPSPPLPPDNPYSFALTSWQHRLVFEQHHPLGPEFREREKKESEQRSFD